MTTRTSFRSTPVWAISQIALLAVTLFITVIAAAPALRVAGGDELRFAFAWLAVLGLTIRTARDIGAAEISGSLVIAAEHQDRTPMEQLLVVATYLLVLVGIVSVPIGVVAYGFWAISLSLPMTPSVGIGLILLTLGTIYVDGQLAARYTYSLTFFGLWVGLVLAHLFAAAIQVDREIATNAGRTVAQAFLSSGSPVYSRT